MKQYRFVEFEEKEQQLTEALEQGLNRSLDEREKRLIKWFSECDYETSGILLDWIEELTKIEK